jgi:hypothetical protein
LTRLNGEWDPTRATWLDDVRRGSAALKRVRVARLARWLPSVLTSSEAARFT